jgi:hypothetical protein
VLPIYLRCITGKLSRSDWIKLNKFCSIQARTRSPLSHQRYTELRRQVNSDIAISEIRYLTDIYLSLLFFEIGRIDAVKIFVKNRKVPPTEYDASGVGPIHYATEKGFKQ